MFHSLLYFTCYPRTTTSSTYNANTSHKIRLGKLSFKTPLEDNIFVLHSLRLVLMKSYDAMQTKILTFNLENHYMLNFTYFCSRYKYINIIFFCCHWLAMSNSCYNPIIYGICSVSKTLSLLAIYLNLSHNKYNYSSHLQNNYFGNQILLGKLPKRICNPSSMLTIHST